MEVKDIMTCEVDLIDADTTVQAVARKVMARRMRAFLVRGLHVKA